MSQSNQLENLKPGTSLSPEQTQQLDRMLGRALSGIRGRRKGTLLIHNSIQNTIGIFLQRVGWQVEYEVPFHRGEFDAEQVRFDIVARKGNQTNVIEVKDVVESHGLGQVYFYANAIQLSKTKAQVYLGTDILNYGRLMRGAIGETVRKLMEKEGMGVVLADKYLLWICDNYAQLALTEMPWLRWSKEPIG